MDGKIQEVMMRLRSLLMLLLLLPAYLLFATGQYNLESAPDAPGKLPILIIAPGNGYHKDLPIITDLASRANAAGFRTLRFNWTSRQPEDTDQSYFSVRFNDLAEMIDIAKQDALADTTLIVLAGKSLGSIIAYNTALQRSDIDALILLTPIMLTPESALEYYPEPTAQAIPRLIVFGTMDTDNADIGSVYDYAARSEPPADVVMVNGDHGLNVADYNDPVYNQLNLDNIRDANIQVVLWLQQLLNR